VRKGVRRRENNEDEGECRRASSLPEEEMETRDGTEETSESGEG